jgi:arginine/lysine/ornithine decarboxylase
VIDESIHDTAGVAEWDPLKLSVDVSGLGITGYQAKEWLLSQWQLAAQLGDARRLVCSLTYADDDAAVDRLRAALECLPPTHPLRTGHHRRFPTWNS